MGYGSGRSLGQLRVRVVAGPHGTNSAWIHTQWPGRYYSSGPSKTPPPPPRMPGGGGGARSRKPSKLVIDPDHPKAAVPTEQPPWRGWFGWLVGDQRRSDSSETAQEPEVAQQKSSKSNVASAKSSALSDAASNGEQTNANPAASKVEVKHPEEALTSHEPQAEKRHPESSPKPSSPPPERLDESLQHGGSNGAQESRPSSRPSSHPEGSPAPSSSQSSSPTSPPSSFSAQTTEKARPAQLFDLNPPPSQRTLLGSIHASSKIRAIHRWRDPIETAEEARRIAARIHYLLWYRQVNRAKRQAVHKQSVEGRARVRDAWESGHPLRAARVLLTLMWDVFRTVREHTKPEVDRLWLPRSQRAGLTPLPRTFLETFVSPLGAAGYHMLGGKFSSMTHFGFLLDDNPGFESEVLSDLVLGTKSPGVTTEVWLPMWSIDASLTMPISNVTRASRRSDEAEANVHLESAYLPGHNLSFLRSLTLDIPDADRAKMYRKVSKTWTESEKKSQTGGSGSGHADIARSHGRLAQSLWDILGQTPLDEEYGGGIQIERASGPPDPTWEPMVTRIPFTISPITAVNAFRSAVESFEVSVPSHDFGRLGDLRPWIKDNDELRDYGDERIQLANSRYRFVSKNARVNILSIYPVVLPIHLTRFQHLDLEGRPQETLVAQGGWEDAEASIATYPAGSEPSEWLNERNLFLQANAKSDKAAASTNAKSKMFGVSLGRSTWITGHPRMPLSFVDPGERLLAKEREWFLQTAKRAMAEWRQAHPKYTKEEHWTEGEKQDDAHNKRLDKRQTQWGDWEDHCSRVLREALATRLEEFKASGVSSIAEDGVANGAGSQKTALGPTNTTLFGRARSAMVRRSDEDKSLLRAPPARKGSAAPSSDGRAKASQATAHWWERLEAAERERAEERTGLTLIRQEAIREARWDYRRKAEARFERIQAAGVNRVRQAAQEAEAIVGPARRLVEEREEELTRYRERVAVSRQDRARQRRETAASDEEAARLQEEAKKLESLRYRNRVFQSLDTLRMRLQSGSEELEKRHKEALEEVRKAAAVTRERNEKARQASEDAKEREMKHAVADAQRELDEVQSSTRLFETREWLEHWSNRRYEVDHRQEQSVIDKMLKTDPTLSLHGDYVDFEDPGISAFTPENTSENRRYLRALVDYSGQSRRAARAAAQSDQDSIMLSIPDDSPGAGSNAVKWLGIADFLKVMIRRRDEVMPRWLREKNQAGWEKRNGGVGGSGQGSKGERG